MVNNTKLNVDSERIKNHLLKVCSNTKKLDQETFKNSRKIWSGKGVSVFLDDNDVKEFNNAMNEIRKDDFVRYNFTENFIEEKFEGIISEAFKISEKGRPGYIEQELDKLLAYFKNEIKEWFFIVPIENLSVKRKFSIGHVKFFVMNTNRKKEIKKLFWNILKDNKHYNSDQKKKFLKQEEKYIIEPLSGLTCAEVKVTGVLENAQQIALQKIRTAVSVLKLYSYSNDDLYKRYFGIVGEVIRHINRTIIRYTTDRKSINPLLEKVGYLFEYELDKNRIKFMKKNGFDKINKILKKTTPNDFEGRLLTSIYWFGEAMNLQISHEKNQIHERRTERHENLEYFKSGERFLKLFIALECILIFNDSEPITNNISKRSVLILVKGYEDRKKIKQVIKNLYRVRSKIVHHGEVFVSKYDLVYLTNLVQAVIITLIKLKDRLNLKTHSDLYEYLEKLKLS